MLRSEHGQDLPGAGSADQNGFLNVQPFDDLEHIVHGPLHGVTGGRFIGRADSSSRDSVHVELIRQLRGELVVHMRGQIASEQHER